MDVNVKGVWLGLKAQIPQMIAHIKALSPARQQELASPQAIKRFGQPEEVAEAVVWLCSDRALFVTGTAMAVDAGSTAGIVLPGVVS